MGQPEPAGPPPSLSSRSGGLGFRARNECGLGLRTGDPQWLIHGAREARPISLGFGHANACEIHAIYM